MHKKALEVAQSNIDKRLKPEKNEDDVGGGDAMEALRNVVARPSTPNWKNDDNMNLIEGKSGLSKAELKDESSVTK